MMIAFMMIAFMMIAFMMIAFMMIVLMMIVLMMTLAMRRRRGFLDLISGEVDEALTAAPAAMNGFAGL